MSVAVRWAVGAVAVVLVVCMIIWARGDDHRRGDDVGALGTTSTVAGP
ncbi:hypothetical protein [Nocardioides terrigena]|nr:hypothetical protein [Nocardioides terrigena]